MGSAREALWAPAALSPGDWDLKREELSPGEGPAPIPPPPPDHHISSCAPLRPERLSWTAGRTASVLSRPPPAWMEGGMDLGWRVAAPRPPRGRAGAVDGGEGRREREVTWPTPHRRQLAGRQPGFPVGIRGALGAGLSPIPTAPRAAHPVLQPASPCPPPASSAPCPSVRACAGPALSVDGQADVGVLVV